MVEVSNAAFDSAQHVLGAVLVYFFETIDVAAPFIITMRQLCGLGILRLASPYE